MALEGFLHEFGLADILQLIYFQRKTGILYIDGKKNKIKLSFINGNITGLESKRKVENTRIGRILMRKKLISQNDLTAALNVQEEEPFKLGHIFVKRGLVSKEAVIEVIEEQVIDILVQIFMWKEGRYEFTPQEIPVDKELTISLDTQHLLMGGVQIIDELSVIDGKIDLGGVYKKIKEPQLDEVDDIEQAILKLIDGDSDVSTLINISPYEEFETSKAIISLQEKGIIDLVKIYLDRKQAAVPGEKKQWPFYSIIFGVFIIILIFLYKGNLNAFRVFKNAEMKMNIERLKTNVELYNAANGRYPENLEVFDKKKDSWGRTFIYKSKAQGFQLFSGGPDGIAGTADDVY